MLTPPLVSPQQTEIEKLDELVARTEDRIFTVQTIFPFQLFPTTIGIDREKVTIVRQLFFFQKHTQSILIEDVLTVIVETGFFFATLHIVDRHYPQDTIEVAMLPKNETYTARRVIQGLLIGTKENIDFKKIPTDQLKEKVEEIGSSHLASIT